MVLKLKLFKLLTYIITCCIKLLILNNKKNFPPIYLVEKNASNFFGVRTTNFPPCKVFNDFNDWRMENQNKMYNKYKCSKTKLQTR